MKTLLTPARLFAPLGLAVLALFAGQALLASAQANTPAATTWFVDDSINDGLVAHWKFDESGAATALELVNAAHGTLSNGAAITATPSLPAVNFPDLASLALDGTDDRVEVADDAALNPATSFSLAAWVRRQDAALAYLGIYDSGEQANEWWLFIAGSTAGGANNNRFGFGERGVAEVYSAQTIVDTAWHHVAVVKNGDGANNLSFYVDGLPQGTASVGSVTAPSGAKRIGGLLDGASLAHFKGNLDDLRLYNRALTSAEVARLAAGSACVTSGASWAEAYPELQCALGAAAAGDDIWIGEGVYRPGASRAVSFPLKNGVDLYGGFKGLSPGGNETALGQRPVFDPNAPLTILSGDILGDDVPATFSNYGDNSRHVLTAGPGVTALLDRLAVRGGNADDASSPDNQGGGLRQQNNGSLALNEVAFSANRANAQGGAVFIESPLQVSLSHFSANQVGTGTGGAICAASTSVINNSTFIQNQGVNAGAGALYAGLASQVTASTFLSNTAMFEGGAILFEANGTISSSTFSFNRSDAYDGGAIRANSSLTLTNTSFTRNIATNGGAVHTQNAVAGQLKVSNSTFQRNVAFTNDGGAIVANHPALIENTLFLTNTAVDDGGAIYTLFPITITTSDFVSNTAQSGGGAFFFTNATLTGNWFERNKTVGGGAADGGGILAQNGPLVSRDNTFTANKAARFGGAARVAAALMSGDRFYNNRSTSEGGGLTITGNVTVTHAIFDGNIGSLSGAITATGLSNCTNQLNVFNSLFIRNRTNTPGFYADLRLFDLNTRLVNSTLADPSASSHSLQANRCSLEVRNSIFANYILSLVNGTGANAAIAVEDDNLFFNASPVSGVTSGGHSLTADPLFLNPAAQDYRLSAASPAVDAGLDTAVPPILLTDLDGNLRFSGKVDMGAYELNRIFIPLVMR